VLVKPILITGSHRSGTTWVGNIISSSSKIQYIPDTFAPNGLLRQNQLFDIWYKHVPSSNNPTIYNRLQKLFDFNYTITEALHLKDDRGKFNYRNTPARLTFYKEISMNKILGRNNLIPLLKDPIALFSAEWLYQNFYTNNIVLIRHPAAFVSSLIRMNWRFDFKNFLNQPYLMENYLSRYSNNMKSKNLDIVMEGCILWNCIHIIIWDFKKKYPEWIYKRHEDLSLNPMGEFEDIFTKIHVDFTSVVKEKIESTTSIYNPKEVEKEGKIHQLRRDSKANIKNWQNRLTKDQIIAIRKLTEEISHHFYKDEDWE